MIKILVEISGLFKDYDFHLVHSLDTSLFVHVGVFVLSIQICVTNRGAPRAPSARSRSTIVKKIW